MNFAQMLSIKVQPLGVCKPMKVVTENKKAYESRVDYYRKVFEQHGDEEVTPSSFDRLAGTNDGRAILSRMEQHGYITSRKQNGRLYFRWK
jgi:hypothetical protein